MIKQMAIKPILLNTEMVKAILDGRKTQTRRGKDGDANTCLIELNIVENGKTNNATHGMTTDGFTQTIRRMRNADSVETQYALRLV